MPSERNESKQIIIPHARYFEGILQLRDCNEEVEEWVFETTRVDGKALITQKREVSRGVDLYFSSQRYIKALSKKLTSKFSGEMKITSSLHTRSRDGRDLYRVTVLFRQLPFRKGTMITINGDDWIVLRVTHKVNLRHLKSGKKEWKSPEFVRRYV